MEWAQVQKGLETIQALELKQDEGESAWTFIDRLLKKKRMKPSALYTAAGMNKQSWSRFKLERKISHDELLRICLLLELDPSRAYYMLALEFQTFSRLDYKDLLVRYCLHIQAYDRKEVNHIFEAAGYPPLFDSSCGDAQDIGDGNGA